MPCNIYVYITSVYAPMKVADLYHRKYYINERIYGFS